MKILLIEDDQPTSEILSDTLSAHRYAVDVIADGAAGLEMASQWNYDLILLDVLLPTLNGVEVCRRLRARGCQTPILMLTMKDSNEDVIAGLDAGADDYVAKSCASSQLLARVRALLRRGSNTSASPLLTWGRLCLDPALAQVTYNQQVVPLRPKEYTLLELFLRHPHRVLSRTAIIDHLWPMEETPVEGSVTNLIKDLRRRLKSTGMKTDLIETVYGLGYRLKAAPAEGEEPKRESLNIETNIETDIKIRDEKIVLTAGLPRHGSNDWNIREQRGITAIQKISQRFQGTIEQRITALETAEQSLQAGNFDLQHQIATRIIAHKLAGGLGTFGCVNASQIAQAMEHLLEKPSPEVRLAHQFSQLLRELKQELAKSSIGIPMAQPMVNSSKLVK